ncbi:uroporphyrinogen-III synthase [Nitrosomonas sp. PY1]|uniref:uroporphyrinogen-III synthase n=1 Tax=Nitrosomonas sp. PY1 TaxID=1803906 RepID=UPI001FC8D338|nr:uroporphyrinogen-III synthase [Nitrosomonas sp. PY1]GKS70335.1 uroporphyrinogen-III synthase [Nitrosomonas sp. PY1]
MILSATNLLAGVNVLVTRPQHQCAYLADGIRARGGNPVLFPVLTITDVEHPESLVQLVKRLEQFDWAVFVSPNAVHKAMQFISQHSAFPPHLKIAAVGKGSADALKRYGVNEVLIPAEQFDSEALLRLEPLQDLTGKRVVIFRGVGGRPLLGDTLIQRNASLEYAECYRRKKPEGDIASLLAIWSRGEIHAVIITSSEGLHNLFDMLGKLGQQLLESTPIFTNYERIVRTAQGLGLEKIIKTTMAGDEGLLDSLQGYFGKRIVK